jgi:hypothetical protein
MTPMQRAWSLSAPTNPPVAIRLLEMLRHFDGHDAAANQWVLSILIFIWQQGGRDRPAPTPSLLLVNGLPGNQPDAHDPILSPLFASVNYDPTKPAYPDIDESSYDYRQMVEAIQCIQTFEQHLAVVPDGQAHCWHRSREKVYGDKSMVPFAQRYGQFGVVTPGNNFQIGSIVTEADVDTFLGCLPRKVLDPFHPLGVDGRRWVEKDTPLIGSVRIPDLAAWVPATLRKESPLLLAPYSSFPETPVPHVHELKELVCGMSLDKPTGIYPREIPFFRIDEPYQSLLRSRLRNFPLRYAHFILNTVDGLQAVLLRLLVWLRLQRIHEKPLGELFRHLQIRMLRAIVINLEFLTFWGPGIEVSRIKPQHWVKVLNTLRHHSGFLSRRDLQRKVRHLKQEELAYTLKRLEQEGLVRLDGKHACAVSTKDFITNLGRSPRFPAPPSLSKGWQPKNYFHKPRGSRKRGRPKTKAF